MSGSILDVIVVGGGYAGLCSSYYLKHFGLEHMVFERGKIGQSWRTQAWDSFTLETSNRLNWMPGSNYTGDNPDGFSSAGEFVTFMELFVAKNQLPVSENTTVVRIEKADPSPYFNVTVRQENDTERTYFCWKILIASGSFNETPIPPFADRIHSSTDHFHVSAYRNPAQLRDGAVLIVGSGQSGCQVADELLAEGRNVYLASSRAGRLPRRYRGKDIMDWLVESKFLISNTTTAPVVSGACNQGHTLSLQSLGRRGAVLLGTMETTEGQNAFFLDNLADHIAYADQFSERVKKFIDEYILRKKLGAPVNDVDVDDLPIENLGSASFRMIDLAEHNINTILWATGYKSDLRFAQFPVADGNNRPIHKNGIADLEGIYFLGFPLLRSLKSNYLFGIKDDAGFICSNIYTSIR